MTTPVSATLSGTLSGATKQGSLTPIPLAFTLDAQSGHTQASAEVNAGETKVVSFPVNLGGPIASPDPQTLFLLTCDVANVNITLNSLGVPVGPFNFVTVKGMLCIPGQINGLPVSDVSINNAGTQLASVSITAIFG